MTIMPCLFPNLAVPEGSPVGVVVVVDHALDVVQPSVGGADVLGGAGVPDVPLKSDEKKLRGVGIYWSVMNSTGQHILRFELAP